ncbi:hypothetical protein PYW08_003318 [Mythimna loreyi]|uniref:Uncharacterized protein n=1 Tax=Mythimna loreyi TaxID=667449 RepID=A0ACC2QRZ1_9NEOP|nr:hypothetical protein PYW08_003318 [Mythimna loreyi]
METSKFFKTQISESDERSESDAASRRSSGSELEEEELVGNSGRDSRSFRKRTKSEDGQSSSDNEKGSAPKIPTGSRGGVQSRGRGRGLTAQESAQRAEKLAAEGRHPGAVGAGERPPRQAGGAPDAGADSAEEARRSFGELMVAALRDMGRKRLAKPSSKAKTVLKHATSLSEAFDKALDKSVAKLRAELRAELRAGPAGPGAVRREAVGGGPGQGQGQSQPQPQPEAGSQLLTLVQSELAAFRQQLQQQQQQFQLQIQRQLSLLEGIVLRPPLATSGQRQAATYAAAAAATAAAPRAGPLGQAGPGLYGLYLCFTSAKWRTILFSYILMVLAEIGITAGAHRLWAHKTYKAKLPLEILLMILNSIAFQNSAIDWVRDHRLHHKYSDTDADPHNATRGTPMSDGYS